MWRRKRQHNCGFKGGGKHQQSMDVTGSVLGGLQSPERFPNAGSSMTKNENNKTTDHVTV